MDSNSVRFEPTNQARCICAFCVGVCVCVCLYLFVAALDALQCSTKANVEVSVCIDEGKKTLTHTVHHEHWEYNNCQSTSALFFKWHRHYHYECEAIRKHQITIVCQRDWEFIMRACTTQKLIRCTGFHLYSVVSEFRVKA